jgi:hypothetical protein
MVYETFLVPTRIIRPNLGGVIQTLTLANMPKTS